MFKSIIIICILILNILIINWNFDSNAKSLYDEMNNIPLSGSNGHPRSGNFDWGTIEVISEPILGQNNNINYSTKPSIAVEDDKIYVVWEDKSDYNGAGWDSDIFYRYFNGNFWSDIQVISEPILGQNINIKHSSWPDIAVENGKIYVIWQDQNNTNNAGTDSDIFYRCNLTGNGWEDIQVISEPVLGQNLNTGLSAGSKIAVENGKIYVIWYDLSNINGAGEDSDIFYRCNINGFNWEDIQIISEPVTGKNFNVEFSGGAAIVVENGKIYTVWDDANNTNNASSIHHDWDIIYRCNLTGFNWEPLQVISEPIFGKDFNSASSYGSKIAVENGNIYIVWSDNNNTYSAGEDSDIFYRCNITDSSWGDIQVISEPSQGLNFNIGDSFLPTIAVENGRIYVIWQDYNNTNGAGIDTEIFYKCNFTGYSWEPVQVISEPIEGKDINTALTISPDIEVYLGKSHIVWSDRNDTNGSGSEEDIFYRCIKDPSPLFMNQPDVSPLFGNTSTNFNFIITYFHYDNTPPTEIIVNISGTEYPMFEVDQADTNYIDGKDYFFNIKNLNIEIYTYKFYAFDGKFIWSTKLVNKPIVYNMPPIIITENNLTAFEDVYYELGYNYEDIDLANVGQTGTWEFLTNAEWLTFDTTTAIINGTPINDEVGEYWVNITINDTIDSDFANFTLTVLNINDQPVITTDDIEIIHENEYYQVDYEAVDIDTPQNNLLWSLDSNATWLSFDAITAVLNGTPTNDDVGDYWISLSVSDTEYINYSNFTLQVINVNDPPRIITKNNITAMEDEFYEVHYFAEDIDNASSQLTWSIAANALWLTYNTDKSVINGTPTNDDIGEYWVNISVSDNEFIDFINFTLTVVNTNDPPMIITEDKTNATLGELYSINYEAEDIDPPPITLSWSVKTNTSDWLTIDTYNGWLNGIPSEKDAGIYWVNVTVTDGETGWDYHNFTLKVLKKPVQLNYAPQLFNTSMTPSEGDIKTEFTFSVHYFDEDGNKPVFIQLVINDAAYNMKLKPGENPSNGTYEYSITLSEGSHNYYFTAFDGFESVKTNNMTTPDIKNIEKISTEETSWYWLFLIVIIIIIIGIVIVILVMKKRKAIKLPSVRAEILRAPPEHIALPGATPSADIATPLSAQPIVSEQLPAPKVQVQPSDTIPSERVPAPSLASTIIETQFQLPKATLSKEQQLNLLRERFLRGEVTEETYNKLRSEIEAHTGEDITKDELEEQPTISDQQQPEINESTELETSTISTPELVGKPPQSEQIPEVETQQPQVPEQQQSPQFQQQLKTIRKEQIDEG